MANNDQTSGEADPEAGTEPTRIPEWKGIVFRNLAKQLGSSVLLGVISIFITTVNKTVLTSYQFPSFQVLGLGQMFGIILILGVGKLLKIVDIPDPSWEQIRKVFPLPIFYILNLVFGLGSTKTLNLPMFTVLRRFTLFLVSLGQIAVLGQYESLDVYFTICLMIAGAFIAALNDLTFSLVGYSYIMLNNLFTTGYTLYSKKKFNAKMGTYEVMFYNAVLVVIPAIVLAGVTGDLQKAYNFNKWIDPGFLLFFFLSCVMGFLLIYATFLCTQLTSALTITVVGCIKNVVVTYLGMYIGGDYVFEMHNFIGINVSVIASLLYSYIKYKEQQEHINEESTQRTSSA